MIPASISLGCSSCTLFACLKLSYRTSIYLTVEKRLYSLVPKHKWGWNRKFWSFLLKNHKFWTFCGFVRLELLPRLNNCIAICSLDCTYFSQKKHPEWHAWLKVKVGFTVVVHTWPDRVVKLRLNCDFQRKTNREKNEILCTRVFCTQKFVKIDSIKRLPDFIINKNHYFRVTSDNHAWLWDKTTADLIRQ